MFPGLNPGYCEIPGFQPISAKTILRRFDGRKAFVPEGQADCFLGRFGQRSGNTGSRFEPDQGKAHSWKIQIEALPGKGKVLGFW